MDVIYLYEVGMGYLQDNLEDDMKNALENFKICL